MRITDGAFIHTYLRNLNRSRSRIQTLNLQLSSQQRINSIADDPAGAVAIMQYNARLSRINRYRDTAAYLRSWSDIAAGALGAVADAIQEAKAVVATMGEASEPALRSTLAEQLDHLLAVALDGANATLNGRSLFGGTNTNPPAYAMTGGGAGASYNGTVAPQLFRLGDSITQEITTNGLRAFGSTAELFVDGSLDAAAPVGAVVTGSMTVRDSAGIDHTVEARFEKTSAGTWSLSFSTPAGVGDAIVTGGDAELSFDSTTGALISAQGGGRFQLVPQGGAAVAPPVSINLRFDNLVESPGVTSVTGTSVLYSVFDKLAALRDRLRAGDVLTSEDFATLDLMQQTVMTEQAAVGGLQQQVSTADALLVRQRQELQDLKDSLQSVDLVEIGLRLQLEQTALEAALSAGARIIPASLLDYLK